MDRGSTEAFNNLKVVLVEPLVLALPDFSIPFIIECDAAGNGRPLAYLIHALKGRSLQFSTYKKELLALVIAVKKWHLYLLGRKFIIKTD